MSEDIVGALIGLLFIFMFFMMIFVGCYLASDQEHRHQLELEKAKQGIFDSPKSKESFFKKYCIQIITTLIISIIIVLICYVSNSSSDLAKYILEIIN